MDADGMSRLWKIILGALLATVSVNANAVPSYARQTGMDCSVCHTVFPQLTPFGREFKIQGYTLTNSKKGRSKRLSEDYYAPLSAMLQISATRTNTAQPDTKNGNVSFPDQFSLFYAGRISDDLGTFLQITYEEPDDHFTMDNTDVRFAKTNGQTFGLTLNNNPTVQDPWNSTPVWGLPYASSGIAPTPGTAAQIDGTLGQQVAGLGGYLFWNKMIYAEASAYRNSQVGAPQPPDTTSSGVLNGTAPYWRLAFARDSGTQAFEIGTYGMNTNIIPNGISGPTNDYRDIAGDAQYQYLGGTNTFTAHTTYIWEDRTLNADVASGAATNKNGTLKTFRIDGTYYYKRRVGGSVVFFSTNGNTDDLLYSPAPLVGSRTGKPDSHGWILQLNYVPWLNTQLSAQYVMYGKFNGAGANYDGFGRDASDNNTLYVIAWLMY